MKRVSFLFVIIIAVFTIHALNSQNQEITFKYDESGNCIKKYKTIVMSKSKNAGKSFVDKDYDAKTGHGYDSTIETARIKELDIKIYPNPTRGLLKIETEGSLSGTYRILLFDVRGQMLVRQEIAGNTAILNISEFDEGVYILRIKYAGVHKEWKIIKN